MTLAELFHAINLASIRLVNSGGKIQLRGKPDSITPEITAAVAEHKPTLLAMLPVVESVEGEAIEADARAERFAVIAEANGMTTPDQLAEASLEWDRVAVLPRFDPKLEWLHELAVVYLRLANCSDPEVRDRLQALLDRRPADTSGCAAMVAKIHAVERELRDTGRLPNYHWPNDIPPTIEVDLDLWNDGPTKKTNSTKSLAMVL